MGFIDRLLGRDDIPPDPQPPAPAQTAPPRQTAASQSADEQAIARYRYMLQTAPPETIEQAHAEAFSKLTPEQRRMVLEQMGANLLANERAGARDDPQTLARMATRAEIRQPGFMERTLGGVGGGMGGGMGGGIGMGGLLAGGLLSSLAGSFIGSSLAHQFFASHPMPAGFGDANAAEAGAGAGSETGSLADNQELNVTGDDFASGGDTVGDVSGDLGGNLGGAFGGDFGGDF